MGHSRKSFTDTIGIPYFLALIILEVGLHPALGTNNIVVSLVTPESESQSTNGNLFNAAANSGSLNPLNLILYLADLSPIGVWV